MSYDGEDHMVGIIESHGSTVLTTKTFVWCDGTLCEERDSTGHTVNKRFYEFGEQISGTNYYYAVDHLGSIREMTDSNGTVQANYDYDTFGRRTALSQAVTADFVYTGFYINQTTGLNLAEYRAYDPEKGRWLNRDPLEELDILQDFTVDDDYGSLNSYSYVSNSTLNYVDPDGQRKRFQRPPLPPNQEDAKHPGKNKRGPRGDKHNQRRSGAPERKDADPKKMPFRWHMCPLPQILTLPTFLVLQRLNFLDSLQNPFPDFNPKYYYSPSPYPNYYPEPVPIFY